MEIGSAKMKSEKVFEESLNVKVTDPIPNLNLYSKMEQELNQGSTLGLSQECYYKAEPILPGQNFSSPDSGVVAVSPPDNMILPGYFQDEISNPKSENFE